MRGGERKGNNDRENKSRVRERIGIRNQEKER
jgi:hypothetical protein